MTDLFWPGDERAGDLMGEPALLSAMVRVEQAWLDALVAAGLAPTSAKADLKALVSGADVEEVAGRAEGGGNPVIPLLALLRERVRPFGDEAAEWLHRGLTSQDVVDTALMLCLRDVLDRLDAELRGQVQALVALADKHRATLMVGRTLTQHAVPITFGVKAAWWLTGVLDAVDAAGAARPALSAQVGGAAGTLAATTELARVAGQSEPAARALAVAGDLAAALGLFSRMPWHTSRSPVTRVGDALVSCTDACGRIASDVVTGSRPEIAELGEPTADGRGESSTIPHKRNPVLSVLVRRAAIAAPPLAATLHTAAALADDERPDGAWHVEWATLRTLARHTVVAASQTTELLGGLRVNQERMRVTLDTASDFALAERGTIGRTAEWSPGGHSGGADSSPGGYLGAADLIVDAALLRAARLVGEQS